jgi:DNA-binding Xre family transcriptional regulator
VGKVINRFPEYFEKYKKEQYEKKGLTQADIAKKWKVNASTLSRYANGYVAGMPFAFIDVVCRDMGITPNDLMWQEDDSDFAFAAPVADVASEPKKKTVRSK